MNFKYCIFLLFCGLQSIISSAQVVRGKVVEKQSRNPIAGVTIEVRTNERILQTLTDSLGWFKISNIPAGRCDVMATSVSYLPYTESNIIVSSGKETVMEIALEERVSMLEEVIVKQRTDKTAALNKMAIVSSRMLSMEEANRYAGTWFDPARMVANFAGVTVANDSRNDIVIRGNSPMGLLWRLDGFDIPNPNHFGAMGGTGGPISILNNNQLANSDFYTSAFPAEFGNALSGVFDLKLRNGNDEQHELMGMVGVNGVEAGAEGPLSKKSRASYMINARYSFLELMSAMGIKFVGAGGAVPEYQDVSGKINIPLKKGNLSVVTIAGASQIHIEPDMNDDNEWIPGDVGQDVRLKNLQLFTGLNYTHRFTNNTRLENRFSYQSFSQKIREDTVTWHNESRGLFFNNHFKEAQYSYSAVLSHRFSARNYISASAGANLYVTDLKDAIFRDGNERVLHDAKKNSTLIKGFVEWQHRFSDILRFTGGVYSQYYTLNKDWIAEPRAGLRWDVNARHSLSVGSGLHSQLQPKLVYFFKENDSYPNEHVKMTHSWQNVIGYDWKLAQNMRLKAEGYYQYLFKVPVIPRIPQESILNFGDEYYNNWDYAFVNKGTGTNYGIELTLEKFLSNNYYFLFTTSLYNSTYKGFDGIQRNTKFSGNYTFNLLGGYEWKISTSNILSFNTKIAYMGGKRYVPASGTMWNWMYDYSQAYTNKQPDYFRVDINVSLKNFFKKATVEAFVELDNVTNHKNIWTQYYNDNQKKIVYVYQYSFMPIGGVRVYF